MKIILDLFHPVLWSVRHVCSDKAEFSFLKKKPLFDALSNMYQTDVWSVRCIRCHSRCKEQNKWRRFVVLSLKKSLDEFRNTPNVGNNSKTSCCFPFMRSVTSCNWFLAVTEKSFCIAIRI